MKTASAKKSTPRRITFIEQPGKRLSCEACRPQLGFHFVNPEFAKLMPPANTVSAISVYALMLATGSLLVCWPLASLLRRYLPQLVGYPRTHGPLLPALETATAAH
jgi:hypothetical protein